MEVNVDTGDQGGKTLADAPRAHAVAATGVYEAADRDIDDRIRRIVRSSLALGRSGQPS
jgi:membrane fusion protein (multidrug efflux system)